MGLAGGRGEGGDGRGEEEYRVSHKRPSVAVCFFVLSSFTQRDWMVSESRGAASWRSRSFCWGLRWSVTISGVVKEDGLKVEWRGTLILPIISFLTGVKATDPSRSVIVPIVSFCIHEEGGSRVNDEQ